MSDKEMNEISPSSTSTSIADGSTSPLSSSSSLPSSSQSIKLIVKAPIQTVEDKIVDCDLTWTVAKLKAHISEIYPSKPSVNDQRLIYSGHLLKNDQVLGDILKAPSDNSTYTVHLVCNVKSSYSTKQPQQSQQKQVKSEQPTSKESSNQMSDQAQNVASSVAESNTEHESPNNTQTDFNQNHQHLFSQATLAGLFSGYPFVLPTNYLWTNFVNPTEPGSDFSIPSSNLGGAGGSISMDQLTQNVAWMSNLLQFQMFQQMYAQYLAQHMNQAALTLSPPQLPNVCLLDGQLPTQIASAAASTSAASAPQPSQRNINNVNNNNNNNNNIADAAPVQEPIARARLEPAAPVPGIRLNPAPAVAPVDEEEDLAQRDWIDWLSYITRGVALASFIYLYASFGRFMLVTVLYFLYRFITSAVEAYNAFLTIGAPRQPVPVDQQNNRGVDNDADNHNNNINNNNNNNNNNNLIPNDDQNHIQQVMDGNIDNHHANNNSNNNNPVDGRRSSNEQSKIRLLFIMVKALFLSLIPLQLPALYPNRG